MYHFNSQSNFKRNRKHNVIKQFLGSIVVSIPVCHTGDRGSIPRQGVFFSHVKTLQASQSLVTFHIEKYRVACLPILVMTKRLLFCFYYVAAG